MPDHPVALAMIRLAGVPIAAPSANLSGKPSPTEAAHVLSDLNGRIAGIIDGGSCSSGIGLESTVVDCTSSLDEITILRPGGVTREQLLEVVTTVHVDPHLLNLQNPKPASCTATTLKDQHQSNGHTEAPLSTSPESTTGRVLPNNSKRKAHTTTAITANAATFEEQKAEQAYAVRVSTEIHEQFVPRAPGMKYTHYAPKAPLFIVDGSDDYFVKLVKERAVQGEKVGVLVTEEKKEKFDQIAAHLEVCGKRSHLLSVAQNLYGALRGFDKTGVTIILSESFPLEGLGQAIMNRLSKAAGQKFIREADMTSDNR